MSRKGVFLHRVSCPSLATDRRIARREQVALLKKPLESALCKYAAISDASRLDYHRRIEKFLDFCKKSLRQKANFTSAPALEPLILEYFDSLSGGDGGVLANLRRYITDEHLDKKKASWDDAGWTDHTWHAGTPRQRNGWDCAVFMCKTADYYAQDARLDFSQDDMDYFRRRLALEIHNKTLLT